MNKQSLLKTVFSLCMVLMCWLPASADKTTLRGDVNNDGSVTIKDVTVLINYLLTEDEATINRASADVNADGELNIKDVTVLINYLLTDEWPAVYEPQYMSVTVGSGTSAVTFRMVLVEGGTMMMGAREDDPYVRPWESPAHQVTLSSYYIAEFEVTQALWRAVMGTSSNPFWFTSSNGYTTNYQRPVESVAFTGSSNSTSVSTFLTKLNQKTGKTFRLPTEAEWEFAARGGNWSRGYMYIGGDNVDEVAWHKANSGDLVQPVGTKAPNELGIYDMAGNVEEWVSDWYGLYTDAAQTNPTGPSTGSVYVLRGGSWDQSYRMCRPTQRHDCPTAYSGAHTGFRVALSL